MSSSDNYLAMSDDLRAANATAPNDLVIESNNLAAAAFRTAARLQIIAGNKRSAAAALRQLSLTHFRRGNPGIAEKFTIDADDHEIAAEVALVQAEESVAVAVEHIVDANDATPDETPPTETPDEEGSAPIP